MLVMNGAHEEWSHYYRDAQLGNWEALHARFVEHRYPRHAHDYFVIALVESGAVSCWYRGADRLTPAGDVFVVNADEPHTGEAATRAGYIYRVLYPRAEYLARVAADIGTSTKALVFNAFMLHDRRLSALLSSFHKRLAENAPKVESESLLLRALAHLLTRYAEPRIERRSIGREHPAIRKTREFMETHFTEDISLSTLSGVVSLSPHYFAHAFEREVGIPPHAYLEGVRIRKACELLNRGETLVSTALAVGYSDQSHLTHRFKRFLGITPGQYMRESKD